jgi:hypothetical protein
LTRGERLPHAYQFCFRAGKLVGKRAPSPADRILGCFTKGVARKLRDASSTEPMAA